MKIAELKINGVKNPLGFDLRKVLCSWKVTDTAAKKQVYGRVEVSDRPDFSRLLCKVEGERLSCCETEIKLELRTCTRYFWRVFVKGDNGETAVSEIAYFETGKGEAPWIGTWIGCRKEDTFHPVFRKVFFIEQKTVSARLYICGLGLFEAYLNGDKVGDEFLTPYINDYLDGYQILTFDISDMLSSENELQIFLGKGWYMGCFGLEGRERNFGSEMKLLAELQLEYEDGSSQTIGSDETWQYRGSDIEESGIYFGEILNRQLWRERENPWRPAVVTEAPGAVRDRYSLPVRVQERLHPVRILQTPKGETVVDFGQNHAGIMEIQAELPAGTRVEFACGEALEHGCFYRDNYRDAEACFVYVSDGQKEVVRPHFTYFGYRYLKVTGWPKELKLKKVRALVLYSDMDRTGYIETGNEKINRLYENCIWGQKSNFMDLPTDCPQRSERLGWTGDAQVFCATASYNMDTRAFYEKFLKDLQSEQKRADGRIVNFIPSLGEILCCSAWGDAGTFIPDVVYHTYGNLEQMRTHYPMMREWVEYMNCVDAQQGCRGFFCPDFQFGDWLALDGVTEQSFKGSTEDDYLGTAYYYQSVKLTGEMAKRLGYHEDAARYRQLADKIRGAFLEEYFAPGGRLALDTQASYLVALRFGLYRSREKVLEQLKNRLKRDNYQIRCGFVGAPLMCAVLCENGMEEIAYRLLFREEYPGWLYCVNLGATTIWERWNSVLPDGTFQKSGMNSLNHYAYGAVVEALYAYTAGIRALEPGYKRAVIRPLPDIRFRRCFCSYNSASGKYVSNWEITQDGSFQLHVEIPFDCDAVVVLPRYQGQEITLPAGSYDFSYQPSRDFRLVYGADSCLWDFEQDQEVKGLLEKKLPRAYEMVKNRDPENMSLTLPELSRKFRKGFPMDAVQEVLRVLNTMLR